MFWTVLYPVDVLDGPLTHVMTAGRPSNPRYDSREDLNTVMRQGGHQHCYAAGGPYTPLLCGRRTLYTTVNRQEDLNGVNRRQEDLNGVKDGRRTLYWAYTGREGPNGAHTAGRDLTVHIHQEGPLFGTFTGVEGPLFGTFTGVEGPTNSAKSGMREEEKHC